MPDDETVPSLNSESVRPEPRHDPRSDRSADPPPDPPAAAELPLPAEGASPNPTDSPAPPEPSAPAKSGSPGSSAPLSIRRPHQSQHTPKDAKGRFLRKDGSFTPAASRPRKKRKREPTRIKHFRVDLMLTDPAQRAEYDQLLADPNSTSTTLCAWLHAHGHSVCKQAVQRHRRHAQVALHQLRECSQMASMFCTLSRQQGAGAIAEATQGKFEMDLMQDLFAMREGRSGRKSPRWWNQMSKTLAGMIATRRSVEEMRADFEAKAKAVLAEAQRHNGRDVVARMQEIMGV